MTRADLTEEVRCALGISRKEADLIVLTILDSIVRALKSGNRVEIRGLGSFSTRQRKPRTGRNPKTGVQVDVPAKRVPHFKPSKELKELLNSSSVGPSPCLQAEVVGRTS